MMNKLVASHHGSVSSIYMYDACFTSMNPKTPKWQMDGFTRDYRMEKKNIFSSNIFGEVACIHF